MRILCNTVVTVLSNVVQCRKCRCQKVFENVICLTRVSTASIVNSFRSIVFTINNGMTVIAKESEPRKHKRNLYRVDMGKSCSANAVVAVNFCQQVQN